MILDDTKMILKKLHNEILLTRPCTTSYFTIRMDSVDIIIINVKNGTLLCTKVEHEKFSIRSLPAILIAANNIVRHAADIVYTIGKNV